MYQKAEAGAIAERTNQEWLEALRGPGLDEALADLRAFLMRGLRYALAGRSGVDEATLEEFAQEALLNILPELDSFRGESRFITWAQKIAVRVALTELRRHRWRDVSLDEIPGFPDAGSIAYRTADPSPGPEQQALQQMLLETLRRLISEELTERQRRAMTAVYLQGMPLQEVARCMDSNRNALYKLLHDARQRLQKAMVAEGISSQDVLEAFGP
jgi:RNA polymerase sigma-70 factor (ECF subfamily)